MRTPAINSSAATTDVPVIDDDRRIRDVLGELLTSAGFRVTVAESTPVAVARQDPV
jgi:CheY-like chemotaxis protein